MIVDLAVVAMFWGLLLLSVQCLGHGQAKDWAGNKSVLDDVVLIQSPKLGGNRLLELSGAKKKSEQDKACGGFKTFKVAGKMTMRIVDQSDKAAVRCCKGTYPGQTAKVEDMAHTYGCHDGVTHQEESNICSSQGFNLCSEEQFEKGCATSTGCSFNDKYLWSSSGSCEVPHWPDSKKWCDKDKALVNNFHLYGYRCDIYCPTIGLKCNGQWRPRLDTCDVLESYSKCAERILSSSAICECKEEVCPMGYVLSPGNVQGSWGSIRGKLAASSTVQCGEMCNAEETQRRSFEYSPTREMCNLIKENDPTTETVYQDYIFCSKAYEKDVFSKSTENENCGGGSGNNRLQDYGKDIPLEECKGHCWKHSSCTDINWAPGEKRCMVYEGCSNALKNNGREHYGKATLFHVFC